MINNQSILITGVSRGIGLALAEYFIEKGYSVTGTCRSGKVDALQHSRFRMLPLDLTKPESIRAFAEEIREMQIRFNLFINNAGIGPDLGAYRPEETAFRETFEVNVTGTTFLTELICPFVEPDGKIIFISSRMGSIGECELTDSVAYRMSKAALNMYVKILTNRLRGKQQVAVLHPGWVKTTIAGPQAAGRLTPEESASRIGDFVTGKFRHGIFWNVETNAECAW